MNIQNRYYYLLIAILTIGISSYIFIFPNFQTAKFDPEVIENISKGVTTTIAEDESSDESADENLIYEFTKSFWSNIENLQAKNTSFAGMSAELGAKNYDIPMHPGAVRYFKEIGAM